MVASSSEQTLSGCSRGARLNVVATYVSSFWDILYCLPIFLCICRIWQTRLLYCWVVLQCCAIWTSTTKRNRFKTPSSKQLQKGSTELLILVAVQRQLNLQKQSSIIFKFWFGVSKKFLLMILVFSQLSFHLPLFIRKKWNYLILKENSTKCVTFYQTRNGQALKYWLPTAVFWHWEGPLHNAHWLITLGSPF